MNLLFSPIFSPYYNCYLIYTINSNITLLFPFEVEVILQ